MSAPGGAIAHCTPQTDACPPPPPTPAAQAFLPQIKAAAAKPGARRGRVVFIGTGGGVMSPSPPLLCAYMASKWSVEAYCQTLRMEMQMRELPIDVCMLNPVPRCSRDIIEI